MANNNTDDTGRTFSLDGDWEPPIHQSLMVLQFLICSMAVSGNIITIYLIVTKRVRRGPWNIFLLNLCTADLIASLSIYPYIFIDFKMVSESSGNKDAICSIVLGLNFVNLTATPNLLTLALMAFNRYASIRYPIQFKWHASLTRARMFVFATWLIALAGGIPYFVSYRFDSKYNICRRIWPRYFNNVIFSIVVFFVGSLIPMIIMLLCFYMTLRMFINGRNSDIPSVKRSWNGRKPVILLLGLLIFNFMLWWGPIFIYIAIYNFSSFFTADIGGEKRNIRAIRIVVLLASMNFVCDPLFYGIVSSEYRQAVKKMCSRRVAPINDYIQNSSGSGGIPRNTSKQISQRQLHSVSSLFRV